MMALVKFVHFGAVAIWAGGLVVLPMLLAQRRPALDGDELHGLHRMVRRLYVGWMSPAAAVAIATGAALIVMRQTYVPWFSAKIAAVGLMAMLHVVQGLLVPRVFAGSRLILPAWAGALTVLHVTVVLAVLTLVLAKPDWRFGAHTPSAAWLAPGALQEQLGEPLSPWIDRARDRFSAPPGH